MGLRALGDSAWLFEAAGEDAQRRLELVLTLVKILERERIPEVVDVVSSFASLAVFFNPSDGETVLSWLTSLPPPGETDARHEERPMIGIPVAYGDDIEEVAGALGMSGAEVIALHSGAEYTVAAIGFSPGFPYLLGLPEKLRLPRRDTPRKVEAGSVAIAGSQAGVYPFASQGGWHVLGKTRLPLFDPAAAPPSLLRVGDRVKFTPVERLEPVGRTSVVAVSGEGGMEILEPGALTTIQDLGRPGFRHLGVSAGGAADPVAAMVANRLVGNPDEAAVLECCMTGPILKFHEAVRLACSGWAGPWSGRVVEIPAGGEIDLRNPGVGVRGCIAVAGGLKTPLLMGSRATDLRSGFGGWMGRCLRAGDRIPLGTPAPGPRPGTWKTAWPPAEATGKMIELRFLAGMQMGWFTPEAKRSFRESPYQISPMSDRMGCRLDGPALDLIEARELLSQPVVRGSVQVPPDGRPIVLMAECQTIGGYPQIGHVISADLPKLARAWPGTWLRFREVTLDEARRSWREQEREAALLQTGLDFLR
jgi:KipI family sensor histidine kinase inhibitor